MHSHRASPWDLLLSVSRGLCQYQMVGSPGLGIIAGITAFSDSFLLNFLPSARERGHGGRNDCVGVWCPPSFLCHHGFPSVSNPARTPAAHRMASPQAQDTSSQKHPSYPPNHPACSLFGAPVARLQSMKPSSHCRNYCSDSGVFLIVRLMTGSIDCSNHKGIITLHAALNMTQ